MGKANRTTDRKSRMWKVKCEFPGGNWDFTRSLYIKKQKRKCKAVKHRLEGDVAERIAIN